MGSVVVSEFVSLDGVMEAPGGEPGYRHSGWVVPYGDEAQIELKLAEVLAHEALLIGRRTYESFASAWPQRNEDWTLGEASVPRRFGERMNAMPKYVASTTLKEPAWQNTTVLQGDAMRAVDRLKHELAGDLLVTGSRSLAQALRQHDLVDEYRLMVFPILLGSGQRLFEDTEDATRLQLVEALPLPNGAVALTYRVQHGAS